MKLTYQELHSLIKESIERHISEAVSFTRNGDNTINVGVNNDMTDKENLSKNGVDTRVFGTRNDILFGDGTNTRNDNLSDAVLGRRAIIVTYKNLINYIKNGRKGPIFTDRNLPKTTQTVIEKWLRTKTDEEILQLATRYADEWQSKGAQKDELYNRVSNYTGTEKTARYTKFTIPQTNVQCIALFRMGTFDLSDAIKNGNIRGTSVLATNLGMENDGKIDVTYDNGTTPNIEQNFSLNGMDALNKNGRNDHFKNVSQYGAQGNQKYTSINQFLDKSIIYARYALTQEGYQPDVIVSTPSSSSMNKYYSMNLANKLGIPYIDDFFKKDIVNAHLKDGITDEMLMEKGFSENDIVMMKNSIKLYAYKEMVYEIETPLRQFIKDNFGILGNLRKVKYDRSNERVPFERILNVMSRMAFATIKEYVDTNDAVLNHLATNFKRQPMYVEDYKYIWHQITLQMQLNGLTTSFNQVLIQMLNTLKKYATQLYSDGYRLRYGANSSKITSMDKRFRNYIQGSFIVADKNLKENGELFNRLKNSKFLIVDEDVNSGASFKLSVDALQEKLPTSMQSNIMCLANGFSESGV